MFSATAMTPEMRRRMALEMARMRVAQHSSRGGGVNGSSGRRLLAALPCHDYEKAFAGTNVPMGVVEMNDVSELEPWLLVARPVTRKEAEKKGGCIRFTPRVASASRRTSALSTAVAGTEKPRYYCITDTDDEVYGRAAYVPRGASLPKMCKSVSLSSQDCTEDDEASEKGVPDRSRAVTPRRNDSCRCVVRV